MSLIDRTGTFRGVITDHGVSVTSTGLPQLVAQLQGSEYYDTDEKVWVDWSQYDEREITAYLVLFNKNDKENLHSGQIKKVSGWSGKSFTELNDMDMSNVKLQFRVKENTYEENTSIQVEWIDEYDATPGRSVKKLEKKELSELDAKYSNHLKAISGGTAPVKAPAKPKAKPVVPVGGPKPITAEEAVEAEKNLLKKPVRTAPDMPEGKRTKKEAFSNCVSMKAKDIPDDVFSKAWVTAVNNIVGEKTPDSKVTPEQWFKIEQIVLKETAVF